MSHPLPALRRYGPADAARCADIYRDAVLNGTAPHYTARDVAAWAPPGQEIDFGPRLAAGWSWVALADDSGRGEGFVAMRRDGHLDLFFVRPEWRRTGLAATLYDAAVGDARLAGHRHLTTFASHLARRFLERRGWHVVAEERALRHGVDLTRFAMALND